VEERIELIVAKYGPSVAGNLEVTLFAVYRDASEVLHGTSFGVIKALTGSTAASDLRGPDDLVRNRQAVLGELLFLTGGVLVTLVQAAARELSEPELEKDARRLLVAKAAAAGLSLGGSSAQSSQK
jgi:hypothetical protein